MLTRNGEQNLGRVLGSVAGLEAEVIVADTGSTDGTVAAARALGARVLTLDWQDDFGAAQNQVLAQAKGEWILWLNPDEELLPDGRQQLANLLSRPDALAYVVRVQEVMKADRPGDATETLNPRLFRRHAELQFIGRLHPTFAVSLEELARRENMQILQTNLLVRHHAYLSVLTPDKLRWATRLLELELKDRPGQLHYLIEYGRNLLLLNDPKGHAILAEAAEQVLAVGKAAQAPTPTVASLLEYLLTVSPEQTCSRILPGQARELALRWFPSSPPLLWQLAQTAFRDEDFQEAAGLLEKLLYLGRTGAYNRSAAFDPSIMAEPAVLNLGMCYLRLGELDRAELCFGQLLGSPPHQTRACQGYAMVQALRRQSQKLPDPKRDYVAGTAKFSST
jgi:tetratricopeptide (TPR) repeat protein